MIFGFRPFPARVFRLSGLSARRFPSLSAVFPPLHLCPSLPADRYI